MPVIHSIAVTSRFTDDDLTNLQNNISSQLTTTLNSISKVGNSVELEFENEITNDDDNILYNLIQNIDNYVIPINYYNITDDTIISTSSRNYITLPNMSVTPTSGTFLIMFSGYAKGSSSSSEISIAIFISNSMESSSERIIKIAATNSILQTQSIIPVDGSQLIEVKIKVLTGTATIYKQTLFLQIFN